MSKQFRFHQIRKRGTGASSKRTDYDPYWLEAANLYYRHWESFPENPDKPRILQDPCRKDFFMPVTIEDVHESLSRIPAGFLRGLQAICLLGGTRKQAKSAWGNDFSYGCYWSDCVFLHPFPKNMLRSVYPRPPKPSDLLEYTRAGAEISTETEGTVVRFDARSLKTLYLQDVLIHEIGHHVDRDNLGNTKENEAFARWFATEFGFRLPRQRRRNNRE